MIDYNRNRVYYIIVYYVISHYESSQAGRKAAGQARQPPKPSGHSAAINV